MKKYLIIGSIIVVTSVTTYLLTDYSIKARHTSPVVRTKLDIAVTRATILMLNAKSFQKMALEETAAGDTLQANICNKICSSLLKEADSVINSVE